MPANIDLQTRKKRHKRWAVLGMCLFSVLILPLAGVLALAVILPLWFALRERLREIERGEEEDASQY